VRAQTLWIREEYLAHILAGSKTIEVRVGYKNITRLQAGDRVMLNAQYPFVIKRQVRRTFEVRRTWDL